MLQRNTLRVLVRVISLVKTISAAVTCEVYFFVFRRFDPQFLVITNEYNDDTFILRKPVLHVLDIGIDDVCK